MARETRADATGNSFESRGRRFARVSLGGGRRKALLLPHCPDKDSADVRAGIIATLVGRVRRAGKGGVIDLGNLAREAANAATEQELKDVETIVDELCGEESEKMTATSPAPSATPTFAGFADDWTSEKLREKYPDHVKAKRSVDDDKYRLAKLEKTIGSIPLDRFTLEDAERAMRELPAGLEPGARRQYAQLISRVLGLAVYPAKIIKVSPIPRKWLPFADSKKAKGILYPDEEARSLKCTEIALCQRIFYAFLAREGLRAGEAVALRVRDIDLVRGVVTLDENKTDDPRAWALDPAVTRALKIWVDNFRNAPNDDATLFVDEDGFPLEVDGLAGRYRNQLELVVKLERRELFERTPSRLPIRIHDLRGAFISYSLAAGRSEAWVQDRTGHTTSAMINRYRRKSRSAKEVGLGGLAPMDLALPEIAQLAAKPAVSGSKPRRSETARTRKARRIKQVGLVAQSVELRTFNAHRADSAGIEEPKSRGSDEGTSWHVSTSEATAATLLPPSFDPIAQAIADKQYDLAMELLNEMKRQREERAGNVVALNTRRKRKGERT